MSGTTWLQFLVLIALIAGATPLLGGYMAKVYAPETAGVSRGERFFAPIERGIYRLTGVDPDREQRWTVYARSLLAFSLVSILFVYLLQRVQGALPGSLGFVSIDPDQAFNTAASFVVNTNWQSYYGEQAMGHVVQTGGLAVQNFVSAAVGMAVAVAEIRRTVPLPIGVNMLKNDVRSALAVAAATGARFVRVNVHVGAVAADQGIIQSEAHDTLRYRRLLGVAVAILADVQAKHGVPLAPLPIEQEARDCFARGLADALVVSGVATGEPTPMSDLKRVRDAVPGAPLLVGSGASPETVAELLSVADAVIVGTSIKRDGRLSNPVDAERVRRLVAAARGARG